MTQYNQKFEPMNKLNYFLILIFLFSCASRRYTIQGMKERNSWWDDRIEAVATVYRAAGAPTVVDYTYTVYGRQFKGIDGFMDGRKVNQNDQFIVAVNPHNPQEHELLGEKHVIS
jgi:hypothetical protein